MLYFSYDALMGDGERVRDGIKWERERVREEWGKGRKKKEKKKKTCVGWYDEAFMTLWDRSQSGLYFNTQGWNQRERNRNASETAWRVCEK